MDLRSAAGHIEHRRGVFVVARGGRQNHCAGKRPLADRIVMDTFQAHSGRDLQIAGHSVLRSRQTTDPPALAAASMAFWIDAVSSVTPSALMPKGERSCASAISAAKGPLKALR